MTTIIATQTAGTTANKVLSNDGFYPDIELDDFRAAMNVNNDVDSLSVENRLRGAMFKVNRLLKDWRDELGDVATLEEVDAPVMDGLSEKIYFYKQAVYAYARAQLMESRREVTTTAKGHDRADSLSETVDDYYRMSHEAVRVILDKTRITVELI